MEQVAKWASGIQMDVLDDVGCPIHFAKTTRVTKRSIGDFRI